MKSLRWVVRDDFIERGRFSKGVDKVVSGGPERGNRMQH